MTSAAGCGASSEAPAFPGLPLAPQRLARGKPAAYERSTRLAHLPDGQRFRAIRDAQVGRYHLHARAYASRPRAEPLEQHRLQWVGLRDAAQSQLAMRGGRQDYIVRVDALDLLEHRAR